MSLDTTITPANPHPKFARLKAAGEPLVTIHIPGLIDNCEAILLQAHLDGSMWVLPWHGGVTLFQADHIRRRPATAAYGARATDPVTSHQAWETVNQYNLTLNQVKVLQALAEAGPTGLIDHDHQQINGLLQDSAGKRRLELVTKGLAAAKTDMPTVRPSPRGANAQIWVITAAGRQALRPTQPPSAATLTALAS